MSPPKQNPGKSKQDYKTPPEFIYEVKVLLSIPEFRIDLAADTNNTQADIFISEEVNSLVQPWSQLIGFSGWGWLNPPYSDITPWVAKCNSEAQAGAKIAMLVPASPGSNWYKKYVHNQSYVLYLNGRLAFMPDKPNWMYPKDLILILWTKWAVGSNVWDWRK